MIQIILVFIGAAVAFVAVAAREGRWPKLGLADVCAHAASYGIGLLGAVVIAISCVASRRRMAAVSDPAGGRTSGWP